MKKPVVVQACQDFAITTCPTVVELICLLVFPIIIFGYWFDFAIKDFKSRQDRTLWDKR